MASIVGSVSEHPNYAIRTQAHVDVGILYLPPNLSKILYRTISLVGLMLQKTNEKELSSKEYYVLVPDSFIDNVKEGLDAYLTGLSIGVITYCESNEIHEKLKSSSNFTIFKGLGNNDEIEEALKSDLENHGLEFCGYTELELSEEELELLNTIDAEINESVAEIIHEDQFYNDRGYFDDLNDGTFGGFG